MNRKRLFEELLKAADRFFRRKPWEEFEDIHAFAIRVPGEEHPMIASILGAAGREFGIALVRGPASIRGMTSVFEAYGAPDVMDSLHTIQLSLTPLGQIPPEMRKFLDEAGFIGRRETPAPHFITKESEKKPKAIRRTEAELVLFVLNGVLKALDAGVLIPEPFMDKEELQLLDVAGDPLDPEVNLGSLAQNPKRCEEVLPVAACPPDIDELPRLDETWLIGYPVLPGTVRGDDTLLRGVLVAELDSGFVHQMHATSGKNLEEAGKVVFATFRGDNPAKKRGLPVKLVFSSLALFDCLSPCLSAKGVECRYERNLPQERKLLASLFGLMKAARAKDHLPDAREPGVPAPDDLSGWKAAEKSLCDLMVRQVRLADPKKAESMKIYFGYGVNAKKLMAKYLEHGAVQGYVEWMLSDYRPEAGSPTLAESLLKKPLPQAQRMLLEARAATVPSIYRITSLQPGQSIILDDVIRGGTFEIMDKALSQTGRADMCLCGRVFPAGRFNFFTVMGPALHALQIPLAVSFMEEDGLDLTEAGFRKDAHLIGRLWAWGDSHGRKAGDLPKMVNNDGDPMLIHTASFAVEDKDALLDVFDDRDDVDFDEREDTYLWIQEGGYMVDGAAGRTLLARMNLIGEKLVVEVNSQDRLRQARSWLEKIPGVKFRSVRKREILKEDPREVPIDERISPSSQAELPEEAGDAMQEFLMRRYMAWLDESIPALKGLTPRQACKTSEGRKSVEILIRTIPAPMGQVKVDIEAIRKKLMAALGLGEG